MIFLVPHNSVPYGEAAMISGNEIIQENAKAIQTHMEAALAANTRAGRYRKRIEPIKNVCFLNRRAQKMKAILEKRMGYWLVQFEIHASRYAEAIRERAELHRALKSWGDL